MFHQPLQEILVALDAQQRRELEALGSRVDAEELLCARSAKKQLANVSVFFIERSWEILVPHLPTFSPEAESGKSKEELFLYLRRLRERQPSFAWGWLRARMSAWLMRRLELCVPELLRQYPEQAAFYGEALDKVDHYWFRESSLHHLKAGYHTALGVACKWYGSTSELLHAEPQPYSDVTQRFPAELRRFASFSLTMLTRTDRYLWDSAGAEPLQAIVEDGTLKILPRVIGELDLENAPDYGLRLGCPALRARDQTGRPAFDGIVGWVEQVFSDYMLHGEQRREG